MSNKCEWQQDCDDESQTFFTECGQGFELNEGFPSDHHMNYCCYCGKALVERPFEGGDE